MRKQLRLLVGVLFGLVVLLAIAGIIAVTTEDADVTELTSVIGPAAEQSAGLLQTMTNAESGLRGYLATGDPDLLQPFNGAQRTADAQRDRLRTLIGQLRLSAGERQDYASMQAAQDAAVAAWWQYANAARAGRAHGQQADLLTGKVLFDKVRAANTQLTSSLQGRRVMLRAAARYVLRRIARALVVTAVLVAIAGFAMARVITRALSVPITKLTDVVHRQRDGDTDVRADEESGAEEVRLLAIDFNVLTARNTELSAAQSEALRLQLAAFDIGRAIRKAAGIRHALTVVCRTLGGTLRVGRVLAGTLAEDGTINRSARWQAKGLPKLPEFPADLAPHLGRVAAKLWRNSERLVVNDIRDPDVRDQSWAKAFRAIVDARAVLVVPVGVGAQVVGFICAVAEDGPRHWTAAEAAAVQQVATFLGWSVTQAEYEAHQAEYVARLEHLDQQKTDFLSTISHELRTPLTSINGFLELLLDGEAGEVNPGQLQMLRVIERNTVRLRGLIEDLLVLNRIESGSGLDLIKTTVSLRELLGQAAEELRPLASKAGVELRIEPGPDAATVTGDRAYLHRALVNIMSNAIKFTPRDGTVRVSCAIDAATGNATLCCADTGIGIPKADLEHLFTRFFRATNATSQAIPGSGLGLAIVKTIVELHGGGLTLDSVEGEGTTVTLRVPLADRASTTV